MNLIRRQLESGTVWSSQHDMSALDGLERAARDADPETLAAWWQEAMALLDDPDIALRTRAVAALELLPFDTAALVARLERGDLNGVRGQGYPLSPEHLDDALYKLLARDCKPEARPTLRKRVVVQPILAVSLAATDTRWLVSNADRVVSREVLGGVLRKLPAKQRPLLLERMGPWPDAIEVLQKPWWRGLEDADALRRIVAAG